MCVHGCRSTTASNTKYLDKEHPEVVTSPSDVSAVTKGTVSSCSDGDRRFSGNASQIAAVENVLRQGSSVTLIQGPPGTGKTITCAEIVRAWLSQNSNPEPVLVAAETNEGVDNLVKKLTEVGWATQTFSFGEGGGECGAVKRHF